MRYSKGVGLMLAVLVTGFPAIAREHGGAKVLFDQVVRDMPATPRQEVRLLTAVLQPGERSAPRAHPWPVTTYVLQGAVTLAFAGQESRTIKAGEATVEPPDVKHTAYNPSTTEPAKLLMFYVSNPGAPFMTAAP